MIIGNGLIAQAFHQYMDDDEIILFASGVSNSKETCLDAFNKEEELLKNSLLFNRKRKVVYFSTTSIYDSELSNGMYCQHKISMENLIKNSGNKYLIFRLSEVVGNTSNQNQILPFLINHIRNRKKFQVWKNATRHLIDSSDVVDLCNLIISDRIENKVFNIASPIKTPIQDIVKIIEEYLNFQAIYEIVDKGNDYNIDITDIKEYIYRLNIKFDDDYIEKLIKKYY